jgi:hypothetical protein
VAQLLDIDGDAGPPPSDGLTLVGETKQFLQRWQRLMLATDSWEPERIAAMRQQSRDLEARAKAADMSGLAHHLQSCEHCFWNGEIDRAKLVACLRNVSEVAWQWRHDLRLRSDLGSLERQGEVPQAQLTLDPSTLLTPPSIELFESSPPPAPEVEPSNEWLDQTLGAWRQPSLLSRIWKIGQRRSSSAAAALSGSAPAGRSGAHPPPPVAAVGSEPDGSAEPSRHVTAPVETADAEHGASSPSLHQPSPLDESSPTSAPGPARERARPRRSAELGVGGIVGVVGI